MKKCLVIVSCVCLVSMYYLLNKLERVSRQRDSYQANTEILMGQVERVKIDSVTTATATHALQLTLSEFKRLRSEDAAIIKKLNMDNKRLKSMSKYTATVEAEFTTPIRDTVVIRDSIPVLGQAIRFEDEFMKINAVILDNKFDGYMRLKTKIRQLLYQEHKHKFLFFRWGRGKVRQVILSDNPYVEINYPEYIEISKE